MSVRSAACRFAAFITGGIMICAASAAGANVIMLSGDSNIAIPLNTNASNQALFTNVLQGGSSVVIQDGTAFYSQTIADHYTASAPPGTTISQLTAATVLTAGTLSGVDLYISVLPLDAYTAAETTILADFLVGGGSIFFIGDHAGFAFYNGNINTVLSALGSGLSIVDDSTFDPLANVATGSQIAADPFTADVTSLDYAAPSQVSGGTPILFGTGGEPFIAYETVLTAIPEPGTLALFGLGLAGLGFARRRRVA